MLKFIMTQLKLFRKFFFLATISLVLGTYKGAFAGCKMKDCKNKKEVRFYYIDFSEFHGNGEIVLLAADGSVYIQKIQNPSDFNFIYQFHLNQKEKDDLHNQVSQINFGNLKGTERVGIPDEVMVRSGLRDNQKKWLEVQVWQTDWSQQNSDVRTLQIIAQKLMEIAKVYKPIKKEKFANGIVKRSKPEGFETNDFW